ncbi:TPA: hypothetical protein DIC20_03365 [Candidatus Dependentiae bacterium]|nr:MAG: hypothetical protein US03_C0001G0063 [candidate division TM6 bacterium GW2011_GWF2_36_131]KKQ03801.1 MAG: hypothetical protein US13_C0001G0141 [candidate division TM6 bacterium GW2011_GWE2_36_25]KKQ19947.1 MAG: hypothetical protein US32_C0003G0064 [candidate division TM6 bacterium GW2011_GWA2_36_9]HBR70569.1 hypothetical protein [Candidatus Dependentiae bacterium]HCU00715.1 hypothetical protein [Candidatus Dependentiae bacterium]
MNANRVFARLICFLFFSTASLFASRVIPGNASSATTTFNFSVGPVVFPTGANQVLATVVTGAGEEQVGNTFSIAVYSGAAAQFIPVGVASATLNNQEKQSNPLTGQKIKFLSSCRNQNDKLLYFTVIDKENISAPVAQQERFNYFLVELPDRTKPTETNVEVVQSDIPQDAAGAPADYIAGMTSFRVPGGQDVVIGAVTPNGSSAFGAGNSGLIAAYLTKSQGGYNLKMQNLSSGEEGNQAISFNGSLSALKVGSDATILNTVAPYIDMHWDSYLQRLYLAVSVTAAAGATDGARSIVVGRFENGKLKFQKIIPDAVVTAGSNTNIIATKTGGTAFVHKVRTMQTTTRLNYLIVNGGNGAIGETANLVYAIPLTNLRAPGDETNAWQKDDNHGIAANVTSNPVDDYNEKTRRLRLRAFRSPAESVSQLFTTSDQAAQVGAGPVPLIMSGNATIKDMFVRDDSVYVSIAADYDYDAGSSQAQQPGIYHSQAIFDHLGRIAAWTPWQRVGGSDDRSYGAMLDASNGDFWYVTGADDSNVNTVKKTLWGAGAEDGLLGGTTSDAHVGLVSLITRQFPEVWGGASAMAEFDANANAVGLPNSGLTGTTTILLSGYEKCMFVETGDNSEATGTIKPYTGDFSTDLASSTDGSFPSGSGRTFVISGGSLVGLGPLVTNTIFSNSIYSWIAVGGAGGAAVLSNASGQGFLPSALPAGFTFKKIGSYKFVQKIVGDGQFLYILTNKTLDRVIINTASFATGSIQKTTIATASSLCGNSNASFSDLIISDKLALLATSKGLYRIANGSSVKAESPYWENVALNESAGPLYALSFSASSTNLNSGLANGGQVYGLSSYWGFDQARIYRFYINEGSSISDTSFRNISDLFVEGTDTYFASFGQMRTSYTDDGSVRFSTRPAICGRAMGLFAMSPNTIVGSTMFSNTPDKNIDALMGTVGSLGRVVRLSSSGAWLLNGSFGLRVNE